MTGCCVLYRRTDSLASDGLWGVMIGRCVLYHRTDSLTSDRLWGVMIGHGELYRRTDSLTSDGLWTVMTGPCVLYHITDVFQVPIVLPAILSLVSLGIVALTFYQKVNESLTALMILAVGTVLYILGNRWKTKPKSLQSKISEYSPCEHHNKLLSCSLSFPSFVCIPPVGKFRGSSYEDHSTSSTNPHFVFYIICLSVCRFVKGNVCGKTAHCFA